MRIHSSDTCIYCGGQASEREHVPPRSLLERPFHQNLATLPACSKCNRGFSLDEEYFIVLLSQIGTSRSLQDRIVEGGSVDRALERNHNLDDRITSALYPDEGGRVMIQPEIDRVNRVIRKIILGLYVLRYGQVPPLDSVVGVEAYPYNIDEMRPADAFVATHTERFQPKRWKAVQKGIFSYIFVRTDKSSSHYCCVVDLHANIWGVGYVPIPKQKFSRHATAAGQLELPLETNKKANKSK